MINECNECFILYSTMFATAPAMQIHRKHKHKQSAGATECALYLTDTLAAGCQRCVRCEKKMRRGSWSGFGSLIATGLETGAATLRSLSSYWKLVFTFAFAVAVARLGARCHVRPTNNIYECAANTSMRNQNMSFCCFRWFAHFFIISASVLETRWM